MSFSEIKLLTANSKRERKAVKDFTKEDLDLDIILQTLSNIQRWAGKLPFQWNILQHCYHCYMIGLERGVRSEFSLYLIIHDFVESLTGDMISPIKAVIPNYCEEFEKPLVKVIEDYLRVYPKITVEEELIFKEIDGSCAKIEELVGFHNEFEGSLTDNEKQVLKVMEYIKGYDKDDFLLLFISELFDIVQYHGGTVKPFQNLCVLAKPDLII